MAKEEASKINAQDHMNGTFYLYMLPNLGESDDEVFIRERVKNSRHPFDAKRKLVV